MKSSNHCPTVESSHCMVSILCLGPYDGEFFLSLLIDILPHVWMMVLFFLLLLHGCICVLAHPKLQLCVSFSNV